MDEVMKKLDHDLLHGMDDADKKSEIEAEYFTRFGKSKTNAKVFCVACGASKRTLRKWHNSYLCEDCFRIAKNVGDEKFIKALKGEE